MPIRPCKAIVREPWAPRVEVGGLCPPHPPGVGAFSANARALGRDPSLNVDLDPRGYLEDLGLILGILAIMVSSI